VLLQYVSDEIGPPTLEDLHLYIGGMRYCEKGERNHLPLRESDFDYVSCLKAVKDFEVRGCVIA
jgi:deoxyribonuclease IV